MTDMTTGHKALIARLLAEADECGRADLRQASYISYGSIANLLNEAARALEAQAWQPITSAPKFPQGNAQTSILLVGIYDMLCHQRTVVRECSWNAWDNTWNGWDLSVLPQFYMLVSPLPAAPVKP